MVPDTAQGSAHPGDVRAGLSSPAVGYRRSPTLAVTASPPGSARADLCCGQDWWPTLTALSRSCPLDANSWRRGRSWSLGQLAGWRRLVGSVPGHLRCCTRVVYGARTALGPQVLPAAGVEQAPADRRWQKHQVTARYCPGAMTERLGALGLRAA